MEISVDQMYRIEESGHKMGFLKKFMMENAGAIAARRLLEAVPVESRRVLIFAGLGNNGGDGLVMARHLAGYGARPTVALLGRSDDIRTEESRWNWEILERMQSVRLVEGTIPRGAWSIAVDAMLGTGIAGKLREPYYSAIRRFNALKSFKIAVDAPSGLNPDTGDMANPCAMSNMTVIFHRMKRGILKHPRLAGTIYVEKIGIPIDAEEGIL